MMRPGTYHNKFAIMSLALSLGLMPSCSRFGQNADPSNTGSTATSNTSVTTPGQLGAPTTNPDGTTAANPSAPNNAPNNNGAAGTPGSPPSAGTTGAAGTTAAGVTTSTSLVTPATGTAPSATTAPKTTPVATAPAAKPAPKVAVAPPPKPVRACYKITFHHKPTAGHSDRESCSGHKNFVKLPEENVNTKSLCLRVDGTPVKYSVVKAKKSKQIIGMMIDSVAGPNSKITATYCLNKWTCHDECKIPKDGFMDAIGGESEEKKKSSEKAQIVQWDPSEKSDERDVSLQLEAELKKELAGSADLKVFGDWVNDGQALACGAQAPVPTASLNGTPASLASSSRR